MDIIHTSSQHWKLQLDGLLSRKGLAGSRYICCRPGSLSRCTAAAFAGWCMHTHICRGLHRVHLLIAASARHKSLQSLVPHASTAA